MSLVWGRDYLTNSEQLPPAQQAGRIEAQGVTCARPGGFRSPLTTLPKNSKPRFFYGWYILAVILLTGLFAGPTSQVFIGLLVEPISNDTGWSPTAIAGAVTFGGILAGVSAPFVGLLGGPLQPPHPDDHRRTGHGNRVLCHRGFSQRMATRDRLRDRPRHRPEPHRGRCPACRRRQLVPAHARPCGRSRWHRSPDWHFCDGPRRAVHHQPGIQLALGMDHIRHRHPHIPRSTERARGAPHPGEMGLLPDGADAATEGDASRAASALEAEQSWTLREAIRTPSFSLIILSIILTNYGGGGLPFHMPQYYEQQGFAVQIGVAAVSMFAISGAFRQYAVGLLAEHISERILGVFTMLLGMVLALGFQFVSHPVVAVGYGVILGIAARGEGSILMLLIANYYGRRSYGASPAWCRPHCSWGWRSARLPWQGSGRPPARMTSSSTPQPSRSRSRRSCCRLR